MNAKADHGVSALHLSAGRGFPDVCALLCDREAHANARDAEGAAPLHRAAEAGFEDVVRYYSCPEKKPQGFFRTETQQKKKMEVLAETAFWLAATPFFTQQQSEIAIQAAVKC